MERRVCWKVFYSGWFAQEYTNHNENNVQSKVVFTANCWQLATVSMSGLKKEEHMIYTREGFIILSLHFNTNQIANNKAKLDAVQ